MAEEWNSIEWYSKKMLSHTKRNKKGVKALTVQQWLTNKVLGLETILRAPSHSRSLSRSVARSCSRCSHNFIHKIYFEKNHVPFNQTRFRGKILPTTTITATMTILAMKQRNKNL